MILKKKTCLLNYVKDKLNLLLMSLLALDNPIRNVHLNCVPTTITKCAKNRESLNDVKDI